MQRNLIRLLRPNAMGHTGYRVFYDQCTPNTFQKLLQKNGLILEQGKYDWGASSYFNFFVPAFLSMKLFNRIAKLLRLKIVASAMLIHARKPPLTSDQPSSYSAPLVEQSSTQ